MIPSEPPWIIEIDGIQFAAPEAVLLLLKAVSEERDQLEGENEVLKTELRGERERLLLEMYNNDTISQVQFDHAMKELSALEASK